MKINISRNVLEKLHNGKIRLIAGTLALTALFSLAGCENKKQTEDTVSINVSGSTFDCYNGEYEYILNLEGIKEHPLKESYYKLNLLRVTEVEKYDNYSFNGKTTAFFNANNYIILPSCYEHYNNGTPNKAFFSFNHLGSKRELEIKKLEGFKGNEFTLITNRIEIIRNLYGEYCGPGQNQKLLQKGDVMESQTLIFNDEIIAFKQTGVGSECDNVIEIGDFDTALNSVQKIIDEDVEVDYKGAQEILEDLEQKKLIKK